MCIQQDNTKMDLSVTDYESVYWLKLPQTTVKLRYFLKK